MKLLLDGDMMCYRVGFACEAEPASVAVMTMNSFLNDLLYFIPVSDCTVEVFLSGSTNFRNDIAVTTPYKGNREKLKKPEHLQLLRDHLCESYGASVSEGQEADDDIAIEATKDPSNSIIVSLDKDFLQVSCWHYNFVKSSLFPVSPEQGLEWFYRQILIGDIADNIKGAEGIGEKKSLKLLENLEEHEMYEVCCSILGEERVLENGRLLWLRRKPGEVWCPN